MSKTRSQKQINQYMNNLEKINKVKQEVSFNRKLTINRLVNIYKEMNLLDYNYFYFGTVNFPEQLKSSISADELELRLMKTLESIPLLEFIIISREIHGASQIERELERNVEVNKSLVGKVHFHFVLSIRGISDKDLNIEQYFFNYEDIIINKIYTEKEYRNRTNYTIKDGSYKQVKYSNFYTSNDFEYKELKYSHIAAFKKSNKLLYLDQIRLFFESEKLVLYSNDKIYVKVTENSYKYVGPLEILYVYYKDVSNYIEKILGQYYIDFRGKALDQHDFKSETFDLNYIEFKNGLYNLIKGTFELNSKIKINYERYFDIEFDGIAKEPMYWLRCLEQLFSQDEIDIIIKKLYYYLNTTVIQPYKDKCLMLLGESSTGKTTLLMDIVRQYHGVHNIGIISYDKDAFNFGNIINRSVICVDEFNLRKPDFETFKNIIDGTVTSINRKNKMKIDYINKLPIILSLNPNNQWFLIEPSFNSRVNRLYFNPSTPDGTISIDKTKLINEYHLIFIYIYNFYHNER